MAARKKIQIQRDRKNISELYLAGNTQMQIAEKLEMTQSMVSRDLKQIQKVWMRETTFDLDTSKAAELARIDKLEVEYWRSWKKSKTLEKLKIVDNEGNSKTVYSPFEHHAPFGAVQYLNGVHRCIDQRRAILGLDAPKNIDIKSGGKVLKFYETVSPDDWDEKE